MRYLKERPWREQRGVYSASVGKKIPVFQEGWIFMTIKTLMMMVFETSQYQQHTIHRMMKYKKLKADTLAAWYGSCSCAI